VVGPGGGNEQRRRGRPKEPPAGWCAIGQRRQHERQDRCSGAAGGKAAAAVGRKAAAIDGRRRLGQAGFSCVSMPQALMSGPDGQQ
jgi:hypothetical protein